MANWPNYKKVKITLNIAALFDSLECNCFVISLKCLCTGSWLILVHVMKIDRFLLTGVKRQISLNYPW